MISRLSIPLLFLALVFTAACAEAAAPPKLIEKSLFCQISGKKIKVETIEPAGSEKLPAVIVLYGSGGAVFGKGEMVDFARQFARAGAAVFLVHYFDRTGTLFVTRDAPIHRYQAVWTDTVRDAIAFVQAQPRVRPQAKVGIFGYSLGAYLSVSEAARDPRVGAVVELSGGIFEEIRGELVRFPPILILHGRLDKRVGVARALEIEKTWKRNGAKPQMHLYEHEGHRLSKPALADVAARGVLFMTQHLHLRPQ